MPSERTVRVRRTATRRSWRNSGSSCSMVPCQLATIVSVSSASTARKPTIAGIVGSSGTPVGPEAPARWTPEAAAATVSVSPSSRDNPISASASRTLLACLAYPASSSTSIVHRATVAVVDTHVLVHRDGRHVLPARLRLRPGERVAVTRRTGRSARTSTTAASRERNGPGGRSSGNRGTDETTRCAAADPSPVRISSRPSHSRSSSRRPASV